MNCQESSTITACPIRDAFKKFKQKTQALASDIIDVDKFLPSELIEVPFNGGDESLKSRVFSVRNKPGFFFIRHALTSNEQKILFKDCILEFPQQCSSCQHSNLQLDGEHLRNAIHVAFSGGLQSDTELQKLKSQQVSKDTNASSGASTNVSSLTPDEILLKLRWITLGVHYDWTSKLYEEMTSDTRSLPSTLVGLYRRVARLCNLSQSFAQNLKTQNDGNELPTTGPAWSPDTAIVNFYRAGDTIGVHDDHSELCNAPLVSVSCGLPALLLVGTPKLDGENVQCFLVRSGDCVVLSGDERLAYHAVPRVFSFDAAKEFLTEEEAKFFDEFSGKFDGVDADRFKAFVYKTRVNISIRQVYSSAGV